MQLKEKEDMKMLSTILIIAFIYVVFGYGLTLDIINMVKDMDEIHKAAKARRAAARRHVSIA